MDHLYRHFDKDGNLLYVGISLSAINRLGQHKNHSHWFSRIARVEIENYQTRQEARDAERAAIKAEKPAHNLHYTTVKELKAEKLAYKESKDDLVKRLVRFGITYSPDEVAELVGMQKPHVLKELENGNLGYIEVEGRKSGRWPVKIKRRITGWQLIDYIEHLERKVVPTNGDS